MKRMRKPSCDSAARWEPMLYEYAEGQASPETAEQVQAHLKACAYCRAALADINWMLAALKKSAPDPARSVAGAVMAQIHREETENGRVIAEFVNENPVHLTRSRGHAGKRNKAVRRLGGIAAVAVVAVGMTQLLPVLFRMNGESDAATAVLSDMQSAAGTNGEDGSFVNGVFFGTTTETTTGGVSAETETAAVVYDIVMEEDEEVALGAVQANKSEAETRVEFTAECTDAIAEAKTEAFIADAPAADLTEEAAEDALGEVLYYAYVYVNMASWDAACEILSDSTEYAAYAGLTEDKAEEISVALYDGYLVVSPASAYETVTAALHAADLIYYRGEVVVEGSYDGQEIADAVYVGIDQNRNDN